MKYLKHIQKVSIPAITAVLTIIALVPTAQAQTYVGATVRIEGPSGTVFNDTVYTSGCTVTDSDDVDHTYTTATALCALDSAATQGDFDYEIQNSVYGIFLNAIDGTASGAEYWGFYVNYISSMVGIADAELADGDEVLFTYGSWGAQDPFRLKIKKKQVKPGQLFHGVVELYNSSTEKFERQPNVPVIAGGETFYSNADGEVFITLHTIGDNEIYAEKSGNTKSNTITVSVFPKYNKTKHIGLGNKEVMALRAADYLQDQIAENGMVGDSQSITEWTAIALADVLPREIMPANLVQAVLAYDPKREGEVTDTAEIARHILALEALGYDSRNTNGVDYVRRLKRTRSNGQYGSELYANDDVFAGLALLAADEPIDSPAIQRAVEGIKRSWNEDGGMSYAVDATHSDVDTTAYAVEFLGALKQERGLKSFRVKRGYKRAVHFLRKQQNLDGGWSYQRSTVSTGVVSNASTTAGVLRALQADSDQPGRVRRNNRNGFNFLKSVQRKSGSFAYDASKSQSVEALNTAYAILALTHESLPVE